MPTLSCRVFVADGDVPLTNLADQEMEGRAAAKVEGKFMGSVVVIVVSGSGELAHMRIPFSMPQHLR